MLRAIVKPYHGGGKNGPTKNIEIRKNQTKKKRMKYTHIFSLSDEKLDGVLLKVCWKERNTKIERVEFEKRFRGQRKE
jgi:hypothetical protein